MPEPLRLAFLGCGFITRVHSRHLRALAGDIVCSYASRDGRRPTAYCRQYSGIASYADYPAAIADPRVDAVVVAVPPRFHLDLTLQALAAGKHVLVEKPAFLRMEDYRDRRSRRGTGPGASCSSARTITTSRWRSTLRRLLAEGAIGEMVFAHFTTIAQATEDGRRLAQRRDDGRRRCVLRGRDPLAAPRGQPRSRGSRRSTATGRRVSRDRTRHARQEHDGGVPLRQRRGRVALLLARDPVALRGLRLSKLFGRDGIITFESNGLFVAGAAASGFRGSCFPGFRDIRGYQAMYRDFAARDPRQAARRR